MLVLVIHLSDYAEVCGAFMQSIDIIRSSPYFSQLRFFTNGAIIILYIAYNAIIVSKNHAYGYSHYCIACLQVVCDVVLSPHEKIVRKYFLLYPISTHFRNASVISTKLGGSSDHTITSSHSRSPV